MSYKSKICIICNVEYIPNSGRQKCCCKKCLQEYNQKYGKKYRSTHDRKKIKKNLIIKTCINCNKSFIANHGNQKCCNKKCLVVHYKKIYLKRRQSDINYKIIGNLRSRTYQALKGNLKSATTKELLGCTIDELWTHLEKQFKPGMTRNNYGEWHVDHILPCVSFDLSKEESQKKCFHYTNLQPLWAEENLKKHCN